jgi:hypothetical protein
MHDHKVGICVQLKILSLDVVLNPLNPEKTKTQLMQMAVETNQQRKGIGKLLVEELSFANPMELKK